MQVIKKRGMKKVIDRSGLQDDTVTGCSVLQSKPVCVSRLFERKRQLFEKGKPHDDIEICQAGQRPNIAKKLHRRLQRL
jgi:hypothetical protein